MSGEIATADSVTPQAGRATALRRRLDEAFTRGKKLCAERNFDYAHEMFAQCVTHDPSNLAFVETMLANLRAKFGDKKRTPRTVNAGNARAIKKAISRKEWTEALKLGIEELKANPWSVPTLRALAEVCEGRHHNEVELAYLKQALESAPRDADVNRHCARSLARMCQFDQAIACWHRVEIIHPGDKEASRMVFQLNEDKILHAQALKEAAAQAKKGAAPVEEVTEDNTPSEAPEALLSARQKLERAIADDPTNVELYLELSELLIDEHRLIEAEEVLQRCIATCGEEPRVRAKIDRIHQIRAEEQAAILASKKRQRKRRSLRLPWLEMVLTGAAIALIMQVAPKVMSGMASFMQNNARILLFLANVAFVVLVFFLRKWSRRSKPQQEEVVQASA
jgi:hypothetical protein